ncbi:hypothetical protein CR513_41014, partial [Mucuna pruriens]
MFGLDCIKELEKKIDFIEPFSICIHATFCDYYEHDDFLFKGKKRWPHRELKTFDVLNEHLFFPHMRKMAKSKVSPHGLYTPLPIPITPWVDISMNFVLRFPRSKRGRYSIFVVLKKGHFIPCHKSDNASHMTNLFFKKVVRIDGFPRILVSDRDFKFLGHFLRLGTKLLYSTTSHPQMDGQTEVVNRTLGQLLRSFVKNSMSKAQFIQRLHGKTRLHMKKKGKQYTKSANKGRKEVLFKEGDLVWVHWRKERFSHLRRSKLFPRGDDPFKILKKINDNAYQYYFNVIDLTPCDASVEAPNLRINSLQEGEDDTYLEGATPALEGPITSGRLKRIQEEVQHNLATLKDQGGHTLYHKQFHNTLQNNSPWVHSLKDSTNSNTIKVRRSRGRYNL